MHRYALAPSSLILALALGTTAARADHCFESMAVATDVAQWLSVNSGNLSRDQRLGGCSAIGQAVGDAVLASPTAELHGATVADFGLLQAHGTVATQSSATAGVLAQYSSDQGAGWVARSWDTLTASTDTLLRVHLTFDYAGSFAGTTTATSTAWGQLRASSATVSDTQNASAGPGGVAHQAWTVDYFMPAGTSLQLMSFLGAEANGSANVLGVFQGQAAVDASFAMTIELLNNGNYVAASGHNYLASAVPEPASGLLAGVGVLMLGGWRSRRRTG